MLTDAYGIKGPIANGLVVTSAVQILLPLPVLVAIVRRRGPAPSPTLSRLGRVVPAVLVVLMMGVSATLVYLHPSSGTVSLRDLTVDGNANEPREKTLSEMARWASLTW